MPTMNEDIQKYPCYLVYNKSIQKVDWIKSTESYNHYVYQLHHFIRKSVRKNSPDFYKRVEHLQKLLLMPAQMNYDIETMGEDGFFKKWGMDKNNLVFNRLKWREGYYDKNETESDRKPNTKSYITSWKDLS